MNLPREAQLLLEPAFFWFIILGGVGVVLLAVLKLIEVFSREKMLFKKAARKRETEAALEELDK